MCQKPPASLPPKNNVYQLFGVPFGINSAAWKAVDLRIHNANLREKHSRKLRRNAGLSIAICALPGVLFMTGSAQAALAIGTVTSLFYMHRQQRQVQWLMRLTRDSLSRLPAATAITDDALLTTNLVRERVPLAQLVRPVRALGNSFDRFFHTPA